MGHRYKAITATLLSLALISASLFSATANAAMVSTSAAVTEQVAQYDRAELMDALNKADVRDQLVSMGVDPDVVEQRIQSMTPAELAQLNSQIDEMPAGQDVVGVLLTVFIVFVITDMLCATNLFSFVDCIN